MPSPVPEVKREPRERVAPRGKPDSSTKAYLWRQNIRFIDTLVMAMEDNGARAGDINRSVVLRAAISALERAGMELELSRCADESELTESITARLTAAQR
jgi:hypothetical protein